MGVLNIPEKDNPLPFPIAFDARICLLADTPSATCARDTLSLRPPISAPLLFVAEIPIPLDLLSLLNTNPLAR